MPTRCEESDGEICTGIFSWAMNTDGFNFTMEILLSDMRNLKINDISYFGAIGFSLDELMVKKKN